MAAKRQKHPSALQGHRARPSLLALPTRNAEHAWTRDELASLTRDALRVMAEKRGLPVGGLKADVVSRLLAADLELALPDLPAVAWVDGTEWHPMARLRWTEMWSSAIAATWDRPGDMGALTRYIVNYDRWLKLDEMVRRTPLVKGSMKQARPNPLFVTMATVAGELRVAEEKFGLTLLDRMRAGIEIGGAAEGLKTAADILAEEAAEPDDWAVPEGWEVGS